MPSLKDLTLKVQEVVVPIADWIDRNPELTKTIILSALALTGLLAVLLPLSIMLPGLILMWGGLTAAISFFVAGPGVLVVAAILGIIAVIIQVTRIIKVLRDDWDMVWLGIKTIAAESTNAVIGFVEKMLNFIIAGVNKAIEAINKVIRAAQKVPGFGGSFSTISKIEAVDFGRIDTDAIASSALNKPTTTSNPLSIYVTGNTFLDQYGAEQVGDLIMQKLKASSPI